MKNPLEHAPKNFPLRKAAEGLPHWHPMSMKKKSKRKGDPHTADIGSFGSIEKRATGGAVGSTSAKKGKRGVGIALRGHGKALG